MKDAVITTIRIPREDYDLVTQVCEDRRESISGFIRRAVLKELAAMSFFPAKQKKALGIAPKAAEATAQ